MTKGLNSSANLSFDKISPFLHMYIVKTCKKIDINPIDILRDLIATTAIYKVS